MPSSVESISLVLTLAKAHKRLVGQINSELKTLGVSFEVWSMLKLLLPDEGRTMSELARSADMASPAATKLIDKLVSDNIVYRRHSRTDRRVVKIFLTEKGHAIIADGERTIESVIAQLNLSDGAIATLAGLLGTMGSD